jgi:transposase
MSYPAKRVHVSRRQRELLESLVRRKKTPQDLAERARIVLMSKDATTAAEQANRLGVDDQRVGRWRNRWAQAAERLADAEAEGATDDELENMIRSALKDAPRSGAPPRFSAEQVARLLALACESPEQLGLAFTHWTPTELARVLVEQRIVDSISPRQVGRFLKGGRDSPPQGRVLAQP